MKSTRRTFLGTAAASLMTMPAAARLQARIATEGATEKGRLFRDDIPTPALLASLRPLLAQWRALHAAIRGLELAKLDDDLGAFAGRELEPVERDWAVQEPGIGGDERERPVVVEAEVVDAGVGGVEQPQADATVVHLKVGVVGAVDEQLVAEHADEVGGALPVGEWAAGVERLVLHDDGEVIDAVCGGQRQAVGLVVVDDEQPGDATVDVIGGLPMRVGVVPQRGRGLVDPPAGLPHGSRVDPLMGAAVHGSAQVHAVPVQRTGVRQGVGDAHAHVVAASGPQGGSQMAAVGAPRVRGHAGHQLGLAGLEREALRDSQGAVGDAAIARELDPHAVRIAPEAGFERAGDEIPQFLIVAGHNGGQRCIGRKKMIDHAFAPMAVVHKPLVEAGLLTRRDDPSHKQKAIYSLAEPAMIMIVFTLALLAGSTQLSTVAAFMLETNVGLRVSLGLALIALIMVAIAENARIPVDNPATHLELTMVHEAMILEYSGRHLALIEAASFVKLLLYVSVIACVFAPWGIAVSGQGFAAYLAGLAVYAAKLAAGGSLLAVFETAIAKMRVFRVSDFLGAALMLGLLATLLLFVSRGT